MPATFSASASVAVAFGLTDDPVIGSRSESFGIGTTDAVGDGTGALQANAGYVNRFAIPAATTLVLDLTNLPDSKLGFGGAVSFSAVKSLTAINQSQAGTADLLFGTSGAAAPSGYAAYLEAGGGATQTTAWRTGRPVTTATKLLHVANVGAVAAVLDLAIVGVGTYLDT